MKALLINFPQNDFCSFGAVEIPNSEKIICGINNILQQFDFIILNQLWLEADDIHFAANYPFYKPGMTKKIEGSEIILTPIFCVKNSFGAEISSKLRIENNIQFEKSGFAELNGAIIQLIKQNKIQKLYICGFDIGLFISSIIGKMAEEGVETVILNELYVHVNLNLI